MDYLTRQLKLWPIKEILILPMDVLYKDKWRVHVGTTT